MSFDSLFDGSDAHMYHNLSIGSQCNIDPSHPAALVPTQIECPAGGKIWCVMHKPTGTLLHIRINDDAGNLIFTAPDNLDWWIARNEEQAKAQAAFLGDDFVAAFFVSRPTTLRSRRGSGSLLLGQMPTETS